MTMEHFLGKKNPLITNRTLLSQEIRYSIKVYVQSSMIISLKIVLVIMQLCNQISSFEPSNGGFFMLQHNKDDYHILSTLVERRGNEGYNYTS